MTTENVLTVENLETHLGSREGVIKAVNGSSFTVDKGETVCIVGESGSGKTMTALSIMGLVPSPPLEVVRGSVILDGEDMLQLTDGEIRQRRSTKMGMIFQDPENSLNPTVKIGPQIAETMQVHLGVDEKTARSRAVRIMDRVGIPTAATRYYDYPFQFSGGMRQRVMIAIALCCDPLLLIADEPTTALDVTIQLQYLKLLKELQANTDMAILFITHDFGVIARMCDRVAVMYAGRIVETGPVRDVFDNPSHPYTQALIASVPKMARSVERLHTIEGQPPVLSDLPEGCRFEARCPHAEARCRTDYPDLFKLRSGHAASCWRLEPA